MSTEAAAKDGKRLDSVLVELNLAPTRNRAQQRIAAGEIEILRNGKWTKADRPSQMIAEPFSQYVRASLESEVLKYVSRAGHKLEHALKHTQLDVQGFRVLDVGLSTGGFTDCLLQSGAAAVLGVDVGHNQVHTSLSGDTRLTALEGLDGRNLLSHTVVTQWLNRGIQLVVVDVSFISLLLLLGPIAEAVPKSTKILALLKPQFEVGPDNLDKNGIVNRDFDMHSLLDLIPAKVQALGWKIHSVFPSGLAGQDGNQEYFIWGERI